MLKRSNIILLAMAVVLGIVATYLSIGYLHSAQSQIANSNKVAVVIVKTNMASHQLIQVNDVAVEEVDANAVQQAAFHSLSEVVGKYTSSAWYAGQQVLQPMVTTAAQSAGFSLSIPVGYRAMTLPDNPLAGVDHLIAQGDHVDIVAYYSGSGGNFVKTVLQDVLVLKVDQAPPVAVVNKSNSGSTSTQPSADTITVAVTPSQAQALYYVLQQAKFELTLRNPKDSATEKLPSYSQAQVGK